MKIEINLPTANEHCKELTWAYYWVFEDGNFVEFHSETNSLYIWISNHVPDGFSLQRLELSSFSVAVSFQFVTILMPYIVVLRPCRSLTGIKYIKQNKAKEIEWSELCLQTPRTQSPRAFRSAGCRQETRPPGDYALTKEPADSRHQIELTVKRNPFLLSLSTYPE